MSDLLISALIPVCCPVCSGRLAAPFFDAGSQPLATLGWPGSAAEAQAMARHAQDYVQCPACSHVWNRSFDYDDVPYQNNPNRMFNRGGIWKGHLAETRDLLLGQLPDAPVVIDIGCGEGHFVRGLAEACGGRGRFLGFDPNTSPETGRSVDFHARLFEPLADILAYRPDALVVRHVLEHLTDPASFVEQLAWGASALDKQCLLFAEVPCIDRVLVTHRLADFFYEHPAHFTRSSFLALMERAGEVVRIDHGYDGEVVYAVTRLAVQEDRRQRATAALGFAHRAERDRNNIRQQLDDLARSGQRVAIWGGTGKAAAFIHQFGADAGRFPLVVDSDPDKAGTFVPGTGQQIFFRDILKGMPVDVVIIPTQWRAKDIVAEMKNEGIVPPVILIEHDGQLIEYATGSHPYS